MDYVLINLILVLSIVISLGSHAYINAKYKKTSKIITKNGFSGRDVARKILDDNGLKDVRVTQIDGMLSDHYDPRSKSVNLSDDIYDESSIASVSVAAHECGHAIQDKDGYFFLRVRSSIVPIVNIASYLGYVSILVGAFFGAFNFITIGIICEAIILLFQLVTLPVEFDASKRGILELQRLALIEKSEVKQSRSMLTAAALTYVAGVATSLLQIARLLLIAGRRRD